MIPQYIFEFLMRWEGGSKITNHASDTGGLTKYGISQKHNPDINVADLTEEEAKNVYFLRYWFPSKCPQLESYMQLVQFNCAVNCGVNTANKILQKVLGVTPDGVIGPVTFKALKDYSGGAELFVCTYLTYQVLFYLKIILRNSSQEVWVKGWLRRSFSAGWVTAVNL